MTARSSAAAPEAAMTRGTGRARSRRRAAGGTVTMQARIDTSFAHELVTHDAAILGLEGPSDLVREGLRLVHRRAQEMDLASAYDEFYGGQAAPLPDGVAAGDVD